MWKITSHYGFTAVNVLLIKDFTDDFFSAWIYTVSEEFRCENAVMEMISLKTQNKWRAARPSGEVF